LALMLRMRLHKAENFAKSEPTYFSLINIPYKAGQKLGLFDRALDGQRVFTERCAGCHGSDARGSAKGPRLDGNARLSGQSIEQLASVISRGSPALGMPRIDLPTNELNAVASYIQSMNTRS
jgi:mono/diheme cytochrome c family protein